MIVIVPPTPPSQEAQDLAEKISELVRLSRERDPDLSNADVRQAMRLAENELGSGLVGASRPLLLVLGGLLVAFGLGVFLYLRKGGQVASIPWVMISLVGGVTVAVGLAAVALRR